MSLSQPTPPDPAALAQAQFGYNTQAAGAQQGYNQTNQVTPYGSLTWQGVGGPNPTATQTLTPAQQGLLTQYQGLQGGAGGIGSNFLTGLMGKNLYTSPNNTTTAGPKIPDFSSYSTPPDFTSASAPLVNSQMQAFQKYMAPFYAQQQSNLNSQLYNQGIAPGPGGPGGAGGNDAYTNAQRGLLTSQDQAAQAALMNFEPQAYQQAVQTYNQPFQSQSQIENIYGQNAGINQTNAQIAQIAAATQGQNLSSLAGLFGLSAPQGVQQPFINPPQVNIQPPNYMGAAEQNYAQQNQLFGNTMQGLSTLGAAGIKGLFGLAV